MANLADDDLLLVQRTSAGISTNYSITGSALKEDLGGPGGLIVPPVEVLTPINGAGITEFDQYEPLSSAITAVSGGGTFDRTTDEIQSVTDISNWNQSQTWSSGTYTGSQPPSSNYVVEYAFNELGEDGGSFGPGNYWAIESGGEATLTFSSPITLSSNSTVEILGANYEWVAPNGGGMTFICSNGSVPVTLNAVNNAVAKTTISDAYTTFGSQITAITLTAASNGWMSLVGLFVDGKRLVDAGITGATITGKLLSFPTNTNFGEFQVNQLISDYATFDPDSGNGSGGVLSEDKLTLSTGPGQYIERLSDVVAFNDNSYAEYTMSGSSDLAGGVGVGAAGATLYGGAGTCVMYRYNGQVVRYPGNNLIFTLASWGDGDVIGVRLNVINPDHPTVHFTKNGVSQGSVGLSQFSITEDLFAFASLWPGTQSSMTANFGASDWEITPSLGQAHLYAGLNANTTITSIESDATPPTITVSGGTWDDSNKSEVWSDASSFVSSNGFNSSYPATNAFDGSSGTYAQATSSGGSITFTPSTPISYSSSIKILMPSAGAQAVINGGSAVNVGNTVETTIASGSGTLTTLVLTASNIPGVIYIKVDDKFLVDASEDSQAWGDYITISEGPEGNYNTDTTNMFDGNTSTATSLYSGNSRPTTVVLTPPSPITVTSGLRVWMAVDRGQSISVNGSQTNASVSAGWNNTGFTGTLTTLTIGPANAGSSSNIGAIEIDGKLMLTPGARGIGDRKLSSSVSYEKSLTFTDTTELANMVAPLEMADATGSNSLTPTTSNVVSSTFTPADPYFSTTLYQPDGTNRSIETGIDNTEKSLLWFKHRDISYNHVLVDSIRPVNQILSTNNDSGNYYTQDVTALTETGVDLTNWTGWINHSDNQRALVWNFRAKPNFFDIVTWTGNDSVREIPHNLGSKPGFIIIKRYDGTEDWTCYHRSLPYGANSWIQLNDSGGWNGGGWFMNNTEPTSTHFTVGSHGRVNSTGWNYVAYIFAHNEDTSGGNIKCGSYTGTGSPGNVVDLGFEPEFFMVKNISAGGDPWIIVDAERGMPSSGDAPYLSANNTDTESGKNIQINPTSTGVVMNENGGSKTNEDGYTYIYVAIAKDAGVLPQTEITFQDNTSLSALTSGMTIASNGGLFSTPTFSVDTYSGNDSVLSIDNGIDLAGEGGLTWIKYRDGAFGSGHYLFDTERGSASLQPNLSDQQNSPDNRLNFDSSGFNVTIDGGQAVNANDYRYVAWSFRKAPGFFDIQTYTGNGDGNGIANLPHQLGSEPGMIIIKRTSAAGGWYVYHKEITTVNGSSNTPNPAINNFLLLDGTNESLAFTGGSWASTATTFSAPFGINSNFANHEYVAYLFADNPSNGIKCGSFTGNGSTDGPTVTTGFRPTFLLMKTYSASGNDWYIYDDQRPNTKPLYANDSYSEQPDDRLVEFLDDGFKIGYNQFFNANGEKIIYLAIGSPTASGGPAIGTLITDADPSTNKVSVDTTSWPTDYSVSGPSVSASLTSISEISGNTIFGNGSTGTWMSGYYAEGSEVNAAPPGPSEVTFTSQNQGTPAFSGVDATLTSRTWTLESGSSATGPWTLVDSYVDYDVLNSQDGATPWTSNKPTLQPNTYYRIKVQYNSNNADSVESVYNTFKTGDA